MGPGVPVGHRFAHGARSISSASVMGVLFTSQPLRGSKSLQNSSVHNTKRRLALHMGCGRGIGYGLHQVMMQEPCLLGLLCAGGPWSVQPWPAEMCRYLRHSMVELKTVHPCLGTSAHLSLREHRRALHVSHRVSCRANDRTRPARVSTRRRTSFSLPVKSSAATSSRLPLWRAT